MLRAAPPVAVVAGSVDRPYPRQHAGLWARVAEAGAVLSEAPRGSADLGWRFPQRNRIMAGMVDVVVVVECHPNGGSMHTVQAAARRGVPVGAVPGSVRSPASAGTNALLADGCFVVRDTPDVLVAVGLATASSTSPMRPVPTTLPAQGSSPGTDGRSGAWVAEPASRGTAVVAIEAGAGGEPGKGRDGGGDEHAVLEALGWERCSLELLLRRTGLALGVLSATLERLRGDGLVVGSGGAWERASPGPPSLGGP